MLRKGRLFKYDQHRSATAGAASEGRDQRFWITTPNYTSHSGQLISTEDIP